MIRLEQIEKVYWEGQPTEVRALRGIDLVIEEGEYAAITGPSGSGKSTLLHILGCLDRPTRGRYLLDGDDTGSYCDKELSTLRNRRIGFVFQAFHLLPRETALENVMLPFLYRRRKDARKVALEALDQVGLANRATHFPGQLSGGEQQRVAIARAIAKEPDIILADEPTGNLDSVAGARMLELFDQVHARGFTIVLITHEEQVAARASRRIRLRDGLVERTATG